MLSVKTSQDSSPDSVQPAPQAPLRIQEKSFQPSEWRELVDYGSLKRNLISLACIAANRIRERPLPGRAYVGTVIDENQITHEPVAAAAVWESEDAYKAQVAPIATLDISLERRAASSCKNSTLVISYRNVDGLSAAIEGAAKYIASLFLVDKRGTLSKRREEFRGLMRTAGATHMGYLRTLDQAY